MSLHKLRGRGSLYVGKRVVLQSLSREKRMVDTVQVLLLVVRMDSDVRKQL